MSVYKLTCTKTGLVYYGSTKNPLNVRKNKGWYHCSCKDFVNPTMECVEKVDNLNNLLIREDYFIRNNECVNKNKAVYNKEDQKKKRLEHKEDKKEYDKKYSKKIVSLKKYHCSLCNTSCGSQSKLNRHLNGPRCKLKQKSYEKYGENWKEHYLNDNKQRYEKTRREKKINCPHCNKEMNKNSLFRHIKKSCKSLEL